MFSGGKDSFVTACRQVNAGDYVGLISFNNGSVLAEQNFSHGATRLVNRYGEDRTHFEGVYNTAAIIMSLKQWYVDQGHVVLATELPDISPTQMTCFHCQTAMWVAAIAYARAKGFNRICAGYLETDEFCTGAACYKDLMYDLANTYGIYAYFPVWHNDATSMPWDMARDFEMSRNRFMPAVYEPKCILGMPSAPLTGHCALMNYYDRHLRALVQEEVEKMTVIFEHLTLGSQSIIVPDYPVPDPKGSYC